MDIRKDQGLLPAFDSKGERKERGGMEVGKDYQLIYGALPNVVARLSLHNSHYLKQPNL